MKEIGSHSPSNKKMKKWRPVDTYDNYVTPNKVNYQDTLNAMLNTRLQAPLMDNSESMLLSLDNNSGVFFGMRPSEIYPYYIGKEENADGHFLGLGGTGSGKTKCLLFNILRSWHSPLIAFDLKGDMVEQWHRINESKPVHLRKKLKVINPSLNDACSYDPYEFLLSDGEDNLYQNANSLAMALLPLDINTKDPIWRQSCQMLLTGCILYFLRKGFGFIKTMTAVQMTDARRLLTLISQSDNKMAKLAVSQFNNLEDKVLLNLSLDLNALAIFATDPMIMNSLSPSSARDTVNWRDFNSNDSPYDVIIQIDEAKLDAWSPYTQLLINQLLRSLSTRPDKYATSSTNGKTAPLLLLLDEFPGLGYIPRIKLALSTLLSRRVTIGIFIQSMAQLDDIYGENVRQIIMDNCDYKLLLSARDYKTQANLSALTGVVKTGLRSITHNLRTPDDFSISTSEAYEPIILPHEFSTLEDIVLDSPYGVCRIDKIFYKSDRLLPLQNYE